MSAEIPQRACIDMRKYLLHVFVIAVLSICLGGCASSDYWKKANREMITPLAFNPNKILPVHVNPLQYEQYDCSQIGTEMESVTRQLDQLHLDVKKRRKADSNAFFIGMAGAMAGGAPFGLFAETEYKKAKYKPGAEIGPGASFRYYDTAESQYAQLIGSWKY
jgi:hypothetical protein